MNKNSSFGFTLAEVLITLGVIGVIAAITLPSIIQKYREKAVVSQVEKAYAMLNEAFSRAISEYGTVDNWCSINSTNDYSVCAERMRDILSKYLKVTKICTNWTKMGECLNGDVKYSSTQGEKDKISFYSIYYKSMRLANGMGIAFDARNYGNDNQAWCSIYTNLQKDQQVQAFGVQNCGYIYVDINGNKGPNRDGIDFFAFNIRRNGLVGHGQDGLKSLNIGFEYNCIKPIMDKDQGRGSCTAWVLQNKNLDYLHCPNELSWTGKTKCK